MRNKGRENALPGTWYALRTGDGLWTDIGHSEYSL